MQLIYGFVTKSELIRNLPGEVSEFFELSPLALTYSRTRGEYQHVNFVGDVLHTFKSISLDTQDPYIVSQNQVQEIFAVVKTVHEYFTEYHTPYDLPSFQNAIQATHTGKIQNFGSSDVYAGTTFSCVSWVSWESVQYPGTTIKIWLRNEAFEYQYTDYEIITVPPIDLLDRFFGGYGSLAVQLESITVSDTIEKIQEFKGKNPETKLRVLTFDYVNANNPTQKTPVHWGVLIYGMNGDNIDSIKDAIAHFVLSNSAHSQADWTLIFPDIFKRSEFKMLPRWDLVSIPNLTELSALYSSIVEPSECIAKAYEFWPTLNHSWVEFNLSVVPFDYKAISVLAVPGDTNDTTKLKLKQVFPDYIPVGTSTYDFSRMTPMTRAWVVMIVEMLVIAETMSDQSPLSSMYRRVYRDGKLYVARVYNNINYLIAARSNVVTGE